MDEQQPIRIVVEVVSHADVARLEARDDEIRQLILSQDKRIEGLHRTLYEVIEAISNNSRK